MLLSFFDIKPSRSGCGTIDAALLELTVSSNLHYAIYILVSKSPPELGCYVRITHRKRTNEDVRNNLGQQIKQKGEMIQMLL